MLRAVLFDMDGTLLDTQRIYNECWRYAAKKLNFQGDIDADIIAFAGMNRPDAIAYFKGKYGADFDVTPMMKLRDACEPEIMSQMGLKRKPGVMETLNQLQQMGIRRVIATGTNFERASRFLKATGIFDRFDAYLTGEMLTHSKPHPEIFLRAAEAVGCTPEGCVVAEDSHNGVRAGYAAGMRVVMIPDVQSPTDEIHSMLWHCIDTMDALPALIKEANNNEIL
ncbi:MAG: HAD family phosphatase [Clostridia bacterium]|nr:HAD family phosphatase [Clostridia bacterium]